MIPGVIQTFSGGTFSIAQPRAQDVRLDDVAHALARQCRFTGHTREFYSVAQHSVLVSQCAMVLYDPDIVDEEELDAARRVGRLGLLHDASEAYLCDVATPVKALLTNYQALEDVVQAVVLDAFGVAADAADWQLVHDADRFVFLAEVRDLMTPSAPVWSSSDRTEIHCRAWPRGEVVPWSAGEAEARFLQRFHQLFTGGQ